MQGLLALIDDKIRRFSEDFDTDELLGMAVDTLVVFTLAAKQMGLLIHQPVKGPLQELLDKKLETDIAKLASKSLKDIANVTDSEKPPTKTELPQVDGPPGPEHVELNPCPRCNEQKVAAGPMTVQLPDAVCIDCEDDLPSEKMDKDSYLTWIQAGVGVNDE